MGRTRKSFAESASLGVLGDPAAYAEQAANHDASSGWHPSWRRAPLRTIWMQSLDRGDDDLATDVARLKVQLDRAMRRLAALEDEVHAPGHQVVVEDPAARWLEEHRAEAALHRGKNVAIHPTRGIVASGDSLETVAREVKRMGLTEDVLFDVIPRFFE
jgi:hypothetical protein